MVWILQQFTKNKEVLNPAVATLKIKRKDASVSNLGKGISGSVEARKTSTGQVYVVKIYHSKEVFESKKEYRERVLHEYWMIQRLQHANIIQTYGYRIGDGGLRVEIFLEIGTISVGKLLLKAGDKVSPAEGLCIWKQVCHGIEYMHGLNICHRDIKPDNLVLDKETGTVKIIDLATAIELPEDGQVYGLVGSEAYASPETYKFLKYDGKGADIWSLGIFLFLLVNRRLPWKYAKPDDKEFSAFLEYDISVEGVNVPTGGPPTMITDLDVDLGGSESIFHYLPTEAIELTSRIFHVDPAIRAGISDFNYSKWYSAIDSYSGNTPCQHEHILSRYS